MIHPPLLRSWLKDRRGGPVGDPGTALAWRLATEPEPLPISPDALATRLRRSGGSPGDLLVAQVLATEYAQVVRAALLDVPEATRPPTSEPGGQTHPAR